MDNDYKLHVVRVLAVELFGSWDIFLKAANLMSVPNQMLPDKGHLEVEQVRDEEPKNEPNQVRSRKKYTDEELIRQIWMLTEESPLGEYRPTMQEFNKDKRTASSATACRQFGSWENFLKAAGLEEYLTFEYDCALRKAPWYSRRSFSSYSDKELISQVKKLAEEFGYKPSSYEYSKRYYLPIPLKRFGSWENFLKAAGLENMLVRNSREYLIRETQRLAKKLRKVPSLKDVTSNIASKGVLFRRFDSWDDLLMATGLYYW